MTTENKIFVKIDGAMLGFYVSMKNPSYPVSTGHEYLYLWKDGGWHISTGYHQHADSNEGYPGYFEFSQDIRNLLSKQGFIVTDKSNTYVRDNLEGLVLQQK